MGSIIRKELYIAFYCSCSGRRWTQTDCNERKHKENIGHMKHLKIRILSLVVNMHKQSQLIFLIDGFIPLTSMS